MAWLAWQNFLFLAPLLAGVAMAILVVLTGGVGDASDGHADDGGDHDGGDVRDFDLLGWFGIGKGVSLSVMMPIVLCSFGFVGLVFNLLLEPILKIPALYAPIAALAGLFASSLLGRAFAKAFIRFADLNRKTAIRGNQDLVGCTGSTVFEVNANSGAANIKDSFGNIHRVVVRSNSSSIASNVPVKVVAVESGIYLVEVM